jgi:site-specific DNA recombinase
MKPEQEWVWFDVPPIVTPELWDQCSAILLEQQRGRPKPTKRVRHLFVGLAFCTCGGRMQVPSNNPKYICPKCKNKIPLGDLEAIFHEQLRGFVLSPEEVSWHFEQADEVIREKEALVVSAEAKERSLSQDMDRIMALYLERRLTPETFSERHQPLEQQRAQLRSQVPQLLAELDFLRISRASSDEIIREAQDLYGRWSSLTPDEKRRIAEQLTERIVVGQGEVDIHLLFQPSRSELVAGGQRTLSGSAPR